MTATAPVIATTKELKDWVIKEEVEYVDIDELAFLTNECLRTKVKEPNLLTPWYIDYNGLARRVYLPELKRLLLEQKNRFGCHFVFPEILRKPMRVYNYYTTKPFVLPKNTKVYISEPIASNLEKYLIPHGYKCLVVAEDFTSSKGVNYNIGDEIITDENTAKRLIQKGLAYEIDEVNEDE